MPLPQLPLLLQHNQLLLRLLPDHSPALRPHGRGAFLVSFVHITMTYSYLQLIEKSRLAEVAAVASQVIPDPEPIPLSEQSEEVQALFESRAAGREVTAEQLYDKVPDSLKDNPDAVVDYVQGNSKRSVHHLVTSPVTSLVRTVAPTQMTTPVSSALPTIGQLKELT